MELFNKLKAAFQTPTKSMQAFGSVNSNVFDALVGYSYIAMQKVATACGQLVTYVVDENNEVVEEGWLSELIRYPNKSLRMTQYAFFEQVAFWLLYNGNAYIYTKPEGKGNTPLKLELLPSNLVEPQVSNGALSISGYKVQGMGLLPKEHICHVKTLKPGSSFKESLLIGKPRIIDAINGAIQADAYMLNFVNAYFARQAFPPLILESPGNVDDETWEHIKSRFNQAVPGNKLLVLLEGGLKAQPLSLGSKEMDFMIKNSLSEEIIKRLSAGFGVPYSVLMSEYQNKDTSKTTIEEFHTHTIEPLYQNIQEQITLHLQELTGTTERVTHDKFEWIDPLQKLEREKFYYEIGVLDADYFRNMEGYKNIKSNIDRANNELKLKSDVLHLKRELYWRSKDAVNTNFANAMQKKLKTIVKEIERQALEILTKEKDARIYMTQDMKKGFSIPEMLFDITSIMALTQTLLGDDWDKFILGRIRSSESDINVEPDPLANYEQYIKDITKRSTDLIKESYMNMGSEIKESIQAVVAQNPYATNVDLMSMIEEAVKNKTGKLSAGRTGTIARTTATAMNGSAQDRVAKKFKASKIWLSERDKNVRDAHIDADGTSPDQEGYFTVGGDRMSYPGGGSTASQNANCRCILGLGMAVIPDELI